MNVIRNLRVENSVFLLTSVVIICLVAYPLTMLLMGTLKGTETEGYSFNNIVETYGSVFVQRSLLNTFIACLGATVLAIFIGIVMAFFIARTDTPYRDFFELAAVVPFITFPLATAIGWVILLHPDVGVLNSILREMGIPFSFNIHTMGGMIWVLGLFVTPFVFMITASALKNIDPDMEESARLCGAGKFTVFVRVILPLVAPAVTSGALLAFLQAVKTFSIHAVIGNPGDIYLITTAIYRALAFIPQDYTRAAVLAASLLVIATIGTYLQLAVLGRRRFTTISGKGFRPKVLSLGKWKWVGFGFCLLYFLFVVGLPYAVILIRSLKPLVFGVGSSFATVFTGWSLSSYKHVIFGIDVFKRAVRNGLFLSISAATVTMIITAVASYVVTKTNVKGRNFLNFICILPLCIPAIVLAVALLWAYSSRPLMLYGTMAILFLAYITKDLPIGFKTTHSSFEQLHHELEQSSRTCGANWFQQFWYISLPLIKPGLVVGWVLLFTSIFREIGASIILYSYGTEVMATLIFDVWEDGLMQDVCTISIITIVIAIGVVFLFNKLTGTGMALMKEGGM